MELEQILIVEALLQAIQVGFETDCVLGSHVVGLPAGLIRQFRNDVLAIGDFPEVVRRASDAAREDCMDSRSGSLCDAACRIDVRAGRCETGVTGPPAESVDA